MSEGDSSSSDIVDVCKSVDENGTRFSAESNESEGGTGGNTGEGKGWFR